MQRVKIKIMMLKKMEYVPKEMKINLHHLESKLGTRKLQKIVDDFLTRRSEVKSASNDGGTESRSN